MNWKQIDQIYLKLSSYEIREIRQKIEFDYENNSDKLFKQAIQFQKKFANRLVSKLKIEPEPTFSTAENF